MSTDDWLTLAGVVVAAVAFCVAVTTYQLQKRTQLTSDEQQLSDLIGQIQERLASISRTGETATLEVYAANSAAVAGLQGLAIEAQKVAERGGLQPDWFQSVVLAYAFTEAWDLVTALTYWGRAVDIATTNQSRMRSVAARAEFYYNRGLNTGLDAAGQPNDDWGHARADYRAAADLLTADPDGQGPDVTGEQVVSLLVYQSGLEMMIGEPGRAARLLVDAVDRADSLVVAWRKMRSRQFIATAVRQPSPDLVRALRAELRRRGAETGTFPASAARLLLPSMSAGMAQAAPGEAAIPGEAAMPGEAAIPGQA